MKKGKIKFTDLSMYFAMGSVPAIMNMENMSTCKAILCPLVYAEVASLITAYHNRDILKRANDAGDYIDDVCKPEAVTELYHEYQQRTKRREIRVNDRMKPILASLGLAVVSGALEWYFHDPNITKAAMFVTTLISVNAVTNIENDVARNGEVRSDYITEVNSAPDFTGQTFEEWSLGQSRGR